MLLFVLAFRSARHLDFLRAHARCGETTAVPKRFSPPLSRSLSPKSVDVRQSSAVEPTKRAAAPHIKLKVWPTCHIKSCYGSRGQPCLTSRTWGAPDERVATSTGVQRKLITLKAPKCVIFLKASLCANPRPSSQLKGNPLHQSQYG